jgi:WD40 repeat protein
VTAGATPSFGCSFLPQLSATEQRVLLQEVCTGDPLEDVSNVVVDAASGAVLGAPRGTIIFTNDDEYVVTRRLNLRAATPHYATELWQFPDGGSGVLIDGVDAQPLVAPDGSSVVGFSPGLFGGSEEEVRVWRLLPNSVATTALPGSGHVRGVTFRGDHEVVGVGRMRYAMTWDPTRTAHESLWLPDAPQPCDIDGATGPFDTYQRSTVSPDGHERAFSDDARTIRFSAVDGGAVDRSGPALDIGVPADARIDFLRYTPDGRSLLVNIEHPKTLGELGPNEARCRNGDPAGSIVVRLRDANGARLAVPVATLFTEQVVAPSGDSRSLLFRSVDHRTLVVRNAETLVNVAPPFSVGVLTPEIDPTTRFAIDHTGDRVAGTNRDATTVVWTRTGNAFVPGATRTPPSSVQPTARLDLDGIAFSPDGDHLAVKTVDQRLFVWDLAASADKDPAERQLPDEAMARVFYSPDGTIIGVDGIFLFDAQTLRPLGPRFRVPEWNNPSFDDGTGGTRFTVDGDALWLVAERADDTSAVRWRVDVGYLRAQSCALARRNLSDSEISLYAVDPKAGPSLCG